MQKGNVSEQKTMTGGQIFAAALVAAGVDRVFCVPGESFLAALDALFDQTSISCIQCRHESGAGLMAVADARLTEQAGVCMVTRGPGATNAALAMHMAQQDAVPLVFVIGQVERRNLGRGAFQEVDYAKTFSDIAKWVIEVPSADRLAEFVARAWHEATSGTPGPVVISVPEDVWEELTPVVAIPPRPAARPQPAAVQAAEIAERIARAKRPVVLAGGDCEPQASQAALLAFSEAFDLPVAATNKRQHIFPNSHPNWIGHVGYIVAPDLSAALAEADLVIAAGTRLGDVSTQGFRFPLAPRPAQDLIHIHPDPNVIGRNHAPTHSLVSDTGAGLAAVLAHVPDVHPDRSDWLKRLTTIRETLAQYTPGIPRDGLDFGHVARALSTHLSSDAILTGDAGNFVSWMHAMIQLGPDNTFLGSVGGAMGLAIPAAVAAAARYPERQVVGVVGDGGALMTGYELATAQMLGAAPKILVANNASYGVIRAHQEKAYPGRVIATKLENPDFAALGRSFGATGFTLTDANETDAMIGEALRCPGLVVVDVKTSLTRLNMFQSLPDV